MTYNPQEMKKSVHPIARVTVESQVSYLSTKFPYHSKISTLYCICSLGLTLQR
jgi:hypothetical protein